MAQTHEAVVVGAGIAGAAAAFFLARAGVRDVAIVDAGDPLSLTSDKSTECYRNWFPGPGTALVDFTNRSIDLLEQFSLETGERFSMNRRGYLFATADEAALDDLRRQARDGEARGCGPFREHDGRPGGPDYTPHTAHGWQDKPTGTDLISDPALVQRWFPALSTETVGVLHVRRCGWLRAQQLGQFFLEGAREAGARLVRGQVVDLLSQGGRMTGVRLESDDGVRELHAPTVVLSPGPGLAELLDRLGVALPILTELHVKVALRDRLAALPHDAPLMLWQDAVSLPWTDAERDALAESPEMAHLLAPFPPGVHGRPEGGEGQHHALMLWTYDIEPTAPTFPIEWDPHLPEIIVRGMSAMLPAMRGYLDAIPRMAVDGGYYTKTPENRPLVGPVGPEGAFVNAAYSGFGIMTAAAGGELLAAHVTGEAMPDYAGALAPSRFDDPAYLDAFGDATAGQM